MNRFVRYAEYVPLASIIVGFGLIGIAWSGAAGLDHVQGQIPYLISGGLSGLGFIFFGAAAMLVRTIRRGQAQQEELIRELTQTLKKLSPALPSLPESADHDGLVVVGASSFHLSTCRTIGTRINLTRMTREQAVQEGLEPCRVCNP